MNQKIITIIKNEIEKRTNKLNNYWDKRISDLETAIIRLEYKLQSLAIETIHNKI